MRRLPPRPTLPVSGETASRAPAAPPGGKPPVVTVRDRHQRGHEHSRTIVASRESANTSPRPNCCRPVTRPATKPAKTATMISAAAVMIRPVRTRPSCDGAPGCRSRRPTPRASATRGTPRSPSRSRTAREEEDRDPPLDRIRLLDPERRPDIPAEDEHEQSIGRCDREEVEQHCLQREEKRAEGAAAARDVTASRQSAIHGETAYARSRKSTPCAGRHPPRRPCLWESVPRGRVGS